MFFRSYWVLFVDGIELLAGFLLLSSRYVPLALTLLAAIIANIVFHLTMAPMGLPVAAMVATLWAIVATRYRSSFAPLLEQKPTPEPIGAAHSTLETRVQHS